MNEAAKFEPKQTQKLPSDALFFGRTNVSFNALHIFVMTDIDTELLDDKRGSEKKNKRERKGLSWSVEWFN